MKHKFILVNISVMAMAATVCVGSVHAQKHKSNPMKRLYAAPLVPKEDDTYKVLLTGEVKHADSLPALKSEFLIGSEYDEAKVEKPPATKDWYQVPRWLAGKWESIVQYEVNVDADGKRHRGWAIPSHGVADYGKQADNSSAVWDFVEVPTKVKSETATSINYDLTTKQTILKNQPDLLVIKDVFSRRKVDKASGKILQVSQMEQISSIAPHGKNEIELLGSLKEFDAKGHTIGITNALLVYKRIEKFKPSNFGKKKEDLQASFDWYLKTHNKTALIPEREKK